MEHERLEPTAAEEERRKLARCLHDGLCQLLSGICLKAEKLERVVDQPTDDVKRELAAIQGLAREAMVEADRVVRGLRESPLEGGLFTTLLRWVDQWGSEHHTVVDRAFSGEDRVLLTEQQLAAYDIVREGLRNVGQHAHAQRVLLRLSAFKTGLHGRIVDDGVGFSNASLWGRSHFGLEGMRERAQLAGGWLSVRSRPGGGTQISFWLRAGREG